MKVPLTFRDFQVKKSNDVWVNSAVQIRSGTYVYIY